MKIYGDAISGDGLEAEWAMRTVRMRKRTARCESSLRIH